MTLVEPCDTRQMGDELVAKVIKKFPSTVVINARCVFEWSMNVCSVEPLVTPLAHRQKSTTTGTKKTPKKRSSAGSAVGEKAAASMSASAGGAALKAKSISPKKVRRLVD